MFFCPRIDEHVISLGNKYKGTVWDRSEHFLKNGKENFDLTGTGTRDLWIDEPALSNLIYLALWMVAVPNS